MIIIVLMNAKYYNTIIHTVFFWSQRLSIVEPASIGYHDAVSTLIRRCFNVVFLVCEISTVTGRHARSHCQSSLYVCWPVLDAWFTGYVLFPCASVTNIPLKWRRVNNVESAPRLCMHLVIFCYRPVHLRQLRVYIVCIFCLMFLILLCIIQEYETVCCVMIPCWADGKVV